MFYSTQLLSKKGPLATVWLAGHMDKRLKKAQIIDTSISNSVGEAALHCHEVWNKACILRCCHVQVHPIPMPRHALLGVQITSSTLRLPWPSACQGSCCWALCASTRAKLSSCTTTAMRLWSGSSRSVLQFQGCQQSEHSCLPKWAAPLSSQAVLSRNNHLRCAQPTLVSRQDASSAQ